MRDVDEIQRLWNQPKLVFYDYREILSKYDYETIWTKKSRQYRGIIFGLFKNRLDILFWPHYYHNNMVHNANDFKVESAMGIVQSFIDIFGIEDFSKYRVVNIEYGLNFRISGFSDDLVICTEFWKRFGFVNDNNLGTSKKAFQTDRHERASKYKQVKLYAKYHQDPEHCLPDTLRMEIKSKKSAYLNRLGVETLDNLLNDESYGLMARELNQISSELLIIHPEVELSGLDSDDRTDLEYLMNSSNWKLEVLRHKKTGKDRNKFNRMKSSYNYLLDKTGRNVHRLFIDEVEKKLNFLVGKYAPIKIASNENEAKKVEAISAELHIDIMEVCTTVNLSDHKCEVTGLSLEREGPIKKGERIPKYIRTRTLKYLRENDYGFYLHLAGEMVPMINDDDYERPKGVKSLINHTAKQIKNRYYNSKRESNGRK